MDLVTQNKSILDDETAILSEGEDEGRSPIVDKSIGKFHTAKPIKQEFPKTVTNTKGKPSFGIY